MPKDSAEQLPKDEVRRESDVPTDVILENLNDAQRRAVTQPVESSWTRVVAGPGSGKTRVLTCRIAYLLRETRHDKILGVTFTKKAASEMQHRLQTLVEKACRDEMPTSNTNDNEIIEENASGTMDAVSAQASRQLRRVTLGTFHSVCAKILRWNGEKLAALPTVTQFSLSSDSSSLDRDFVIADSAEQMRIIKDCLKEANIDLSKEKNVKLGTIASLISSCKEEFAQGKDPFVQQKKKKPLSRKMQIVAKIYNSYRHNLLSENSVDFDDLIYLTKELLEEDRETREILQGRWRHILVDEFQDTSKSQLELVKLLTADSLLVVGDADQSIYSWRGAFVQSMQNLDKEFAGLDTVYLMENYRSTSNIVKAAQKVISSCTDVKQSLLRQDMKPIRGKGPRPRIIACTDENQEADHVVSGVLDRIKSGNYGSGHQVAILYRTNAQSRAFEDSCVKHGLPYVIHGSATSFYKRQEIKDCLCFLRWIANGRDRGSMLRAMKTPPRGIGDTAILDFDKYCDLLASYYSGRDESEPTPLDILVSLGNLNDGDDGRPQATEALSTRSFRALSAFGREMARIRESATYQSVERLLSNIIDTFALLKHFDKISKTHSESEDRLSNVRELQKVSQSYGTDAALAVPPSESGDMTPQLPPLNSFLDDVALVADVAAVEESDTSEHRVVASLMTIHASKGMEFDTVYVTGLEDGTFPSNLAIADGEGSTELEEEKRLCYVAMTRAKTELFMTWRKDVAIFTTAGIRRVRKNRSRFLDVLSTKKPVASSDKNKGGCECCPPTNNFQVTRLSSSSGNDGQCKNNQTTNKFRKSPIRLPASARIGPNGPWMSSTSVQSNRSNGEPSGRPVTTNAASRRSSPSVKSSRSNGNPIRRPVTTNGASSRLRDRSIRPEATQARKIDVEKTPARKLSPTLQPSTRKMARNKLQKKEPKGVDSTWFFPVGSKVAHKDYGQGFVLPPPPPSNEIDLPVCVKFTSGEQLTFSARENDLSPLLT